MKRKKIKTIVLILLLISLNYCKKREQKSKNLFYSKINNFNNLSTHYFVDSLIVDESKIIIFSTDTITHFDNVRHLQNYKLSAITLLNKGIIKNIDSIIFKVSMPYRKDGDIIYRVKSKKLIPVLEYYSELNFRNKIIKLNLLNKDYYNRFKLNRAGGLIYNLNTYFAYKTFDKNLWMGIDSYDIIKTYERNKSHNLDTTKYNKLFSSILTDTVYWKDNELAKKVVDILLD